MCSSVLSAANSHLLWLRPSVRDSLLIWFACQADQQVVVLNLLSARETVVLGDLVAVYNISDASRRILCPSVLLPEESLAGLPACFQVERLDAMRGCLLWG